MANKDIETSTDDILRVKNAAQSEFEDALLAQFNSMTMAIGALDATWEGPNHDAFVTDYANFVEEVEDFHSAVEAYLSAWNTAARIYLTCETDVAGYIR